jgi:hypothetical protein
MENNIVGLGAVAALGGCAVALQGQFMGVMAKSIGTTGGIFVNYISGAMLAMILLLALQGGSLKAWTEVPWYALSAGALGLVIAGSIGYRGHAVRCVCHARSFWLAWCDSSTARIHARRGDWSHHRRCLAHFEMR